MSNIYGAFLGRVKYLLSLLKLNMSGPKVRRSETPERNEKPIKLEEDIIESPEIFLSLLSGTVSRTFAFSFYSQKL